MCDPLTIAGIALTAGSTVANTMAQNKVAKARSQVMQAERERQARLDTEAQALNTTSQDRYKDFGPDMEKRGAELGDLYATPIPAADAAGVPTELAPTSDSVVTQESQKQQQGQSAKYVGQQAKALGNLRSFGDYLGGVSRLQARDAGTIGQIAGYKKGSADVVPFELDSASHKGDKLKMFGDILNFGGQLALGKGLQGDWATVGGGTNPVAIGFPAAPTGGGSVPFGMPGPWGAGFVPTPKLRPNVGVTTGDLYGDTGRR
jgi:hypothetical protein